MERGTLMTHPVACEEVVQALDGIVELLLSEVGHALDEGRALAVASKAFDGGRNPTGFDAELFGQVLEEVLSVEIAHAVREHVGHLQQAFGMSNTYDD